MSKAELKRRGITRYDAEILLAQGIDLPGPKVNLGGKIPSPSRKNQSIKLNELRLSPRKHLSSQSYLKSLSPDMSAGNESGTSKKHLDTLSNGLEMAENIVNNWQTGALSNEAMKPELDRGMNSQVHVDKVTSKGRTLVHRHSRHGRRTKKLSHRRALQLNVDCIPQSIDSSAQSGLSATGLRHSPRFKNIEGTQSMVDNNRQSVNQSDLSFNCEASIVDSGDSEITFKVCNDTENRNIFTQLQIDVMETMIDSDDDSLSEIARKYKSNGAVECPKLLEHLKARPSEMPHLTPYNSDPTFDTSYKNSGDSPRLTSVNLSRDIAQVDPVNKHANITRNLRGSKTLSVISPESSKPLRHSPRYNTRNPSVTAEPGVVNGTDSVVDVEEHTYSESFDDASRYSRLQNLSSPKLIRPRNSKGSSHIGSNVFEKFAGLSGQCSYTGDSEIDVDNESEEVDIEGFGDGSTTNKCVNSFRKLHNPASLSRKSPRFSYLKNRKRRLSFGDVRAPQFGEPLRKKINALNEDMAQYRHLWAHISSPKKVPKITIKMPRDPVLLRELENTKSESVHFKLESPLSSVPVTPESSDLSDTDEESPLNCTKYRPFIAGSSTRRSGCSRSSRSLYKDIDNNSTDRVCPKLMRIKFGDTQIAINIPQQKR